MNSIIFSAGRVIASTVLYKFGYLQRFTMESRRAQNEVKWKEKKKIEMKANDASTINFAQRESWVKFLFETNFRFHVK